MIYKLTITFKAPEGHEPVSTIMYVVEAAKRKILKKLQDGIPLTPCDDIAFISQFEGYSVVNRVDGTPATAEGLDINGVLEEFVPEKDRKLYLIGQVAAINTSNVAEVKVDSEYKTK